MKILSDIDISSLITASERLDEALKLQKNDIVRDATIQRFEFTYELTWKTLRKVLIKRGSEANTPKTVFRLAANDNIIDNLELWFEFVNFRNNTTHVYNEKVADDIYSHIPKFYRMVAGLITKLKTDEFK